MPLVYHITGSLCSNDIMHLKLMFPYGALHLISKNVITLQGYQNVTLSLHGELSPVLIRVTLSEPSSRDLTMSLPLTSVQNM